MRLLAKAAIAVACILMAACQSDKAAIEHEIRTLSLREKAGMLFIVRPEALDPSISYERSADLPAFGLQEVNGRMLETALAYPVGGVVLFAHNIASPEQLLRFSVSLKALPGHPLLCVDEEGGRVARVAVNPAFDLPRTPDMATLVGEGPRAVEQAAQEIGRYLSRYGFDIDFAPVADVNTNPANIVIGSRAFSDNPRTAARMVVRYLKGLRKGGVLGCLKHFPGHGDTQADTHFGYAVSEKTWEQMRSCEMLPFRAGIRAGAPLVMTAHIAAPGVTGNQLPSTLSPAILEGKLRGELGFKGVIVTDALEMGAITREFAAADACVRAIRAGADMLLCVKDYPAAVDAVVEAVHRGEITEERLDESVRRIPHLKHLARGKGK